MKFFRDSIFKNRQIFIEHKEKLILFVACLIGVASGIGNIYTLTLFLSVIIAFFTFKYTELALKINIILLLIIPYPHYSYYKLVIPGTDVSFFEIEFFLILIIVCFKHMVYKINIFDELKKNKIYMVLLLMLIVYLFVGLKNSNPFLSGDTRQYYIFIFYIAFILILKDEQNIFMSIIKMSIVASLSLSIVVLIMFAFKSTLFDPLFGNNVASSTRVGFGNQAYFVFSFPLIFFALRLKKLEGRWRFFALFSLVAIVTSLLIDETRSLIISTIGNAVFIYIYSSIIDKKRTFGAKIVGFITIFMMLSILAGLVAYYFSETPKMKAIIERFAEINGDKKIQSAEVRSITNKRNIEIILENPEGHGLGSSFNLINTNGRLAESGPFIDNFFITTLNKFGFLGFSVLALFYIRTFYQIFIISRNKNYQWESQVMSGLLLCIPLAIIHNCIYTAQLIMNTPNAVYILFIYASINIIYFKISLPVDSKKIYLM